MASVYYGDFNNTIPTNDSPPEGPYDAMYGYYGNDRLLSNRECSATNHVYLDGGPGNDYLFAAGELYGKGTYGRLIGGDGNDHILGGLADFVDTLEGGGGTIASEALGTGACWTEAI
jgi:hypothetical protein